MLYEKNELNIGMRRYKFNVIGSFMLKVNCPEIDGSYNIVDLTGSQMEILIKNYQKTNFVEIIFGEKIDLFDYDTLETNTYSSGSPDEGNILIRGYIGDWYVHKIYPNQKIINAINFDVDKFLFDINGK